MARRGYARRYSQAVFEIALESKELDRWQSDLGKIVSLAEDESFVAFLESPKFRFDDKAKLLSERLGKINPLALNLVYLLVAGSRFNMVGDIADGYQRLMDGYLGIEQAEVTTAVSLDDGDKQRLSEYLGDIVGKKVVLKTEVDSSLLGGVVARVGGKMFDGSTRSRLEALKKELAGTGGKY